MIEKIKSVFDLPEYRDGNSKEPAIPHNGKVSTNQTTKTDFDVYYDLNNSIFSKDRLDKIVQYQQERDVFEFEPLYSKLVKAAINDKILLSDITEDELNRLKEISHEKNKDNSLLGQVALNPILLKLTSGSDDPLGMLLNLRVNGNTEAGIERFKLGDISKIKLNGFMLDWNNIINPNTFEKEDINKLLDLKVNKSDIFEDQTTNIKDSVIDYILNKEGTILDEHLKNNNIHTTHEEKELWNNKYLKPETGIPESDLEESLINKIKDTEKHKSNNIIHITASDRTSWNEKYTLPAGGIPYNDLNSELKKTINKIFPKSDIIDSVTKKIKDDLIDIDLSSYVTNEVFKNHEKLFDNHIKGTGHITTAERNLWNGKYTKNAAGIPISDLSNSVQGILNNALSWEDILNDSTGKIKGELLPGQSPVEIEKINNHIENNIIHITQNDRDTWNKKYDGITDANLPVDETGKRCIKLNHLPDSIIDIVNNGVKKNEIFNTGTTIIPLNKIDGLQASIDNLNSHILGVDGGVNSHVTKSEKDKIRNSINRTEILDNEGFIRAELIRNNGSVFSTHNYATEKDIEDIINSL